MKTVIYRKIDGHDIIIGFDNPSIEPIETAKKINGYKDESDNWIPGLLEATNEFKASKAKQEEYTSELKKLKEAKTNKDEAAYKKALVAMEIRQDELKPIAAALAEKIIQLRIEEGVYFTPGEGEKMIADEEAESLLEIIKGRPEGTLVKLDGTNIDDNRGCVYFRKVKKKWGRTEIIKLGDQVPSDAVLDNDVTDKQRHEIERDHIAALPESVRANKRAEAINVAASDAAMMRSKLEIQGDKKALVKAQEWYNAEEEKVAALYG